MFGYTPYRLLTIVFIFSVHARAMLLSDVRTPSFILDMQALQRRIGQEPSSDPAAIPSLYIPKHDLKLFPKPVSTGGARSMDLSEAPMMELRFDSVEDEGVGFLHSSVTRAREDAMAGKDDPLSTFLAEIDLTPTLCGAKLVSSGNNNNKPPLATLVLGLNNHHVGSYYWARSAGTGASMDAPGVQYDGSDTSRGVLRWETEGGPTECNTNDGKRSEWVNFLRKGDTIQLLPADGQAAIASFVEAEGSMRVFGVSSEGRPLGSEPEVVCQWACYNKIRKII